METIRTFALKHAPWAAVGLVLWPAMVLADGGCKSAFDSGGCFALTLMVGSVIALPIGSVGALVLALVGRSRGVSALAALACVPVAYLSLLTVDLLPSHAVFMIAAPLAGVTAFISAVLFSRRGKAPRAALS